MEAHLALAGLILALVGFVAATIRGLQTSERAHMVSIEHRLQECEQARAEFERRDRQRDSDILALKGENLRLYQRVDELERKVNRK